MLSREGQVTYFFGRADHYGEFVCDSLRVLLATHRREVVGILLLNPVHHDWE